jgi:tetratricopeptide (TPR) repeat protein
LPIRPRPLVAALVAGACLASSPAPVQGQGAEWNQLRTEHFDFVGHVPAERLGALATGLEHLQRVLAELNAGRTSGPPVPTRVIVFRDDTDFGPYKPPDGRGKTRLSGFFLAHPHLDFVAIDGDPALNPEGLLFHEYLHAFVRHNLEHAPLWLNEGLAEFYSTFSLEGRRAIIGRTVPGHVARLHNGEPLRLARLLALDAGSPEYKEDRRQPVFYAQAWALVHYLLTGGEELRSSLGVYLDALPASNDPVELFRQCFGGSLSDVEKALQSHLARVPMPTLTTELADRVVRRTTATHLAAADRWFELGWLLAHQHPQRRPEARRHFDAALALEPWHAGAAMGLGYLALLEGDLSDAEAYLDSAIAHGGDDYLLHYLRGRTRLRQATAPARPPDMPWPKGRIEAARASFHESLLRHPSFGEAWAALGSSFVADPEPTPEGLEALREARRLLPTRPDVLYNLTVLAGRLGREDEMSESLEILARLGGPDWAARAEEALRRADEATLEARRRGAGTSRGAGNRNSSRSGS